MKKILLTLLIYIAYCIFVQCENDKLQESLVIATILSKLEGYEYKLSLLKTCCEKPEYIVDAPSFEYKLLNTISKMKVE